ncbi:anti-sigma factor antagonist [Prauserella cavernicola]|uniref:Anti-sigma factor antagonist n=1 Tax=Prauserella cavernicola TaxID=2800127 RepID=A0A934QU08_9PSEU|nr:anti-sigma factor antagonist [Prauserella cavernicola]MBK1786485.1 anti-sigma factor antagonist [Prauserella cavernicola]
MRSTESDGLAAEAAAARTSSLDIHGLRIEADHRPDGIVLARVSGEVDLLSAPDLRAWIQEEVAPPSSLVLDLDGVGFLGSAGLSVLAELAERSIGQQLRWAIVASSRVVLRPLEATGLAAQMPVHPTPDDAVRSLAAEN